MIASELFADRAGNMQASEIRELLKVLEDDAIISFAGGIPDPSLFPKKLFDEAYSKILSGPEAELSLQYSVSEGYLPLRSWIVGYMAKLGVVCREENILITSGSQQALDFIGKLFLSPDDVAVVEQPTYLGALQAFNQYQPNYSALDLDNTLPDQAKFIYTVPDFANPTGQTMGGNRRRELLTLAEKLGSLVIEDAPYKELRYSGNDETSILALELESGLSINDARTIFCGSFSKTLSPGLRVGWVCASSQIIEKLVLIKQSTDLHSPTINQMAVYEAIQHGFAEHIELLKASYKAKRDAMLSALDEHMPSGVKWTKPEGGMFIWMELPEAIDAAELLKFALADYKIAFVPGQAFHSDGSGANTLRLNFTHPSKVEIREGIVKLAQSISNFA